MIIGLSGKKLSGKDTTYTFIAEWADSKDMPVRRDAFADRLKISASNALGMHRFPDIDPVAFCNQLKEVGTIHVQCLDSEHPYTDVTITGREYLQWFGTEAHREVFGSEFWLRPIEEAYRADPATLTVITDVRFDNEAVLIHKLGGVVWQINRPGLDTGDQHASEKPLKARQVDHYIQNDDTLDWLKSIVVRLLEKEL